jgi:tetratricopeptide (TPR) repeat protein
MNLIESVSDPRENTGGAVMKRASIWIVVALAGISAGAIAATKVRVGPETYRGKSPESAAADLLAAARSLAEDGSYENIAVGRVLYLTGRREEGQAIFDRVLATAKVEAGDVIRVARVYREAGEWERARPLFDRVLEMAPKDEDWAAEIGAYHLLAGDRDRAEELFGRSFAQDPSNLYNTLLVAGAYRGLDPRP